MALRGSRRRFLLSLPALSLAAHAQESARVRIIGWLLEGDEFPRRLVARLRELDYVEGRNLRFVIRRVPLLADAQALDRASLELAQSGAEVLVGWRADHLLALHGATSKVPIVSYGVSNPVGLGLAHSIAKPGMNVTGLSWGLEEAAVLQFGSLRLLRPKLQRILFVLPPDSGIAREHETAAATLGIKVELTEVKDLRAVDRAFAAIRDPGANAAWVAPLFAPTTKEQVAASAIHHRIATHGFDSEAVRAGMLVSCGLSHTDAAFRAASIIDKVLHGADPGTIPFEFPDKTEIVLNQATATAIGAAIPAELRLRATEIVG